MRSREQEEALLKELKKQEHQLHDELVAATHELKLARQEVASIESKLQMTMAKLNHVRRQLDAIWQAAP